MHTVHFVARACSERPRQLALDDLRGERVTAADVVIVRQRPGTAKGFVFVGLEDETGRLDVIIPPALYEKEREIINGNGIWPCGES